MSSGRDGRSSCLSGKEDKRVFVFESRILRLDFFKRVIPDRIHTKNHEFFHGIHYVVVAIDLMSESSIIILVRKNHP